VLSRLSVCDVRRFVCKQPLLCRRQLTAADCHLCCATTVNLGCHGCPFDTADKSHSDLQLVSVHSICAAAQLAWRPHREARRTTSVADVAVIGAGGPTGRLCVQEAVDRGMSVRAIVRDPTKHGGWPPSVTVVAGDVTQPASLTAALNGARSVVFAAAAAKFFDADSVDHLGVQAAAAASRDLGVGHFVLVSSRLVDPKNRWHPIRLLLNNAIKCGECSTVLLTSVPCC
jgi:hypothetical protein